MRGINEWGLELEKGKRRQTNSKRKQSLEVSETNLEMF
jgi:hypothetical protein